MRTALALLFLTASALFGAITERYVSSAGTDTYANSTNSATPMSLATAFANAVANDRINIKADGPYSFSSAQTLSAAGPIFWRGYSSTVTDGGKATIDGGTAGASYTLLTVSGANHQFQELIFAHNGGASGSADAINITGQECSFIRCVVHDMRGSGIVNGNVIMGLVEVEAYACNTGNVSQQCGINLNTSGSFAVRCISHDNAPVGATNGNGFKADGGMMLYRCIAESNTGCGDFSTGDTTSTMLYTDFYNNTRSGVSFSNSTDMLLTMHGCNFLKNGRYAFEFTTALSCCGTFLNNGFGRGTQVNTLGDVQAMEGMYMIGEVDYANDVTPWVDGPNQNFLINLAASKDHGPGSFLQTAASYAGTVGYNDIGAGRHHE